MIRLDRVSFFYGEKQMMHDFSLSIEKENVLCLFGESGCGKTTVLRLLLGLEKPDSGNIYGIGKWKAAAVFQEDRLLPFWSLQKNIALTATDVGAAEENMKALGLLEVKDKAISSLSGGMKRRAAIARALSAAFDYLILDEPFTGLDDENIRRAAAHIRAVAKDRPIVMVTHSESEIAYMGAKKIIMPGGMGNR